MLSKIMPSGKQDTKAKIVPEHGGFSEPDLGWYKRVPSSIQFTLLCFLLVCRAGQALGRDGSEADIHRGHPPVGVLEKPSKRRFVMNDPG